MFSAGSCNRLPASCMGLQALSVFGCSRIQWVMKIADAGFNGRVSHL